MKHTRVSLLALSALAGGMLIASAADVGTNYNLNITFTNDTLPSLVFVDNVPYGPANAIFADPAYGIVDTDGSGKINGVLRLEIPGTVPGTPLSDYIADVSGTVTTSGKSNWPSVKLNFKSSAGYTAAGQSPSTLSLKFVSAGPLAESNASVNLTTAGWDFYIGVDGITNDAVYWSTNDVGSSTNSSSSPEYTTLSAMYNLVRTNFDFFYTNKDYVHSITASNLVTVETDFGLTQSGIKFGTPVTNTSFGTFQPGQNGSVQYTNYVIGSNVFNGSPSAVFGLDIGQLNNFIAGYNYSTNGTAITTNGMTILNGGILQLAATVVTNHHAATSGSSTNFNRSQQNSWRYLAGTLSGTIKNGTGSAVTVKDVAATLAQTHDTYTQVAGTNNEVNVLIKSFGSMSVGDITGSELDGKVVMFGKNFAAISGGMSDFDYSGKGTLSTKTTKTGTNHVATTVTTYKATLKGVAHSKGSSMSLNGNAGILLNNFAVNTNAAPFTLELTNTIVNPPLQTASAVNAVGYTFYTTNLQAFVASSLDASNNQTVFLTDFGDVSVTNNAALTNLVNNAIITVNASGKISGQKVPVINGINQGDFWHPHNTSID